MDVYTESEWETEWDRADCCDDCEWSVIRCDHCGHYIGLRCTYCGAFDDGGAWMLAYEACWCNAMINTRGHKRTHK